MYFKIYAPPNLLPESLENLSNRYIEHYICFSQSDKLCDNLISYGAKSVLSPFQSGSFHLCFKSFLLLPPSPYFLVSLISLSRQKFPRAAAGFRILSRNPCVRPRNTGAGLVTCLHPFWRACKHTAGWRTRTGPTE